MSDARPDGRLGPPDAYAGRPEPQLDVVGNEEWWYWGTPASQRHYPAHLQRVQEGAAAWGYPQKRQRFWPTTLRSPTYLQAMTTSTPLFVQLQETFPEVVAVNAPYTHGLVVIVSTKSRYGGFAKAVGMRLLTTLHGLGYAAIVIPWTPRSTRSTSSR